MAESGPLIIKCKMRDCPGSARISSVSDLPDIWKCPSCGCSLNRSLFGLQYRFAPNKPWVAVRFPKYTNDPSPGLCPRAPRCPKKNDCEMPHSAEEQFLWPLLAGQGANAAMTRPAVPGVPQTPSTPDPAPASERGPAQPGTKLFVGSLPTGCHDEAGIRKVFGFYGQHIREVVMLKPSIHGTAAAFVIFSSAAIAEEVLKHPPRQPAGVLDVKLSIHAQLSGALIGRGGSVARSIREDTGARFTLHDSYEHKTMRQLTLGGSLPTLDAAFHRICELLEEEMDRVDFPGDLSVAVVVDTPQIGSLIGRGGTFVQEMRDASRAHIHMAKSSSKTESFVVVSGASSKHVATALSLIAKRLLPPVQVSHPEPQSQAKSAALAAQWSGATAAPSETPAAAPAKPPPIATHTPADPPSRINPPPGLVPPTTPTPPSARPAAVAAGVAKPAVAAPYAPVHPTPPATAATDQPRQPPSPPAAPTKATTGATAASNNDNDWSWVEHTETGRRKENNTNNAAPAAGEAAVTEWGWVDDMVGDRPNSVPAAAPAPAASHLPPSASHHANTAAPATQHPAATWQHTAGPIATVQPQFAPAGQQQQHQQQQPAATRNVNGVGGAGAYLPTAINGTARNAPAAAYLPPTSVYNPVSAGAYNPISSSSSAYYSPVTAHHPSLVPATELQFAPNDPLALLSAAFNPAFGGFDNVGAPDPRPQPDGPTPPRPQGLKSYAPQPTFGVGPAAAAGHYAYGQAAGAAAAPVITNLAATAYAPMFTVVGHPASASPTATRALPPPQPSPFQTSAALASFGAATPGSAPAAATTVAAPAPPPETPSPAAAAPASPVQTADTRDTEPDGPMAEIKTLLVQRGLEKYVETFEKEEIDFDVLLHLTESDFKQMGITARGPLVKLQKLQQELAAARKN